MNDDNEMNDRIRFEHERIERALGADGYEPHLVFAGNFCGAAGEHFRKHGLVGLSRESLETLCGLPVRLLCKARNTLGGEAETLNTDVTFTGPPDTWVREIQEKVPALAPLTRRLRGLYAIRSRLMTAEGPALAERIESLSNDRDALEALADEFAKGNN
jgi:hypothetical protein